MLKLVAVHSIGPQSHDKCYPSRSAFLHRRALRANTIAASAPIQTTHASRRAQIPIACTAPPAHDRSRFRALALFGRRPIERVVAIVFTGIQKPAQSTEHRLGHPTERNVKERAIGPLVGP
jgi:hypothetical protein